MLTNIFLATVTAYCNPHHNLASNGHLPLQGITVAGPRSISLGTHIWIENIGERIVTDRTAQRFDGRIDVFMNDKQQCVQFGKQKRKVWIINQSITNRQ